MQLGSLVTIAGAGPANFFHFVFANGVYETSGRQPLPGEGLFDLEQMARSAGYPLVARFADGDEFKRALPALLQHHGPVFVCLGIEPEDGYKTRSGGSPMGQQMATLRERLTSTSAH